MSEPQSQTFFLDKIELPLVVSYSSTKLASPPGHPGNLVVSLPALWTESEGKNPDVLVAGSRAEVSGGGGPSGGVLGHSTPSPVSQRVKSEVTQASSQEVLCFWFGFDHLDALRTPFSLEKGKISVFLKTKMSIYRRK